MPMMSKVHQRVKEATRQEDLWDEGIATSLNHQWGISQQNRLLQYNGRIYIPQKKTLQGEIIAQSHDHILAGHLGIERWRSSCSENTGGPRWRKMSRHTSKNVRHVNKQRAAPKPRRRRSTRTKSQLALGPTSPWIWSLVFLTWMDMISPYDHQSILKGHHPSHLQCQTLSWGMGPKSYTTMFMHATACPKWSSLTEACNLSPNSWRNYTKCST